MRRSHGSSTITGGCPGVSSNRIARGLFLALFRWKNASTEYTASRLSDTLRPGIVIADWSCKNPRSQLVGRSIFSSR